MTPLAAVGLSLLAFAATPATPAGAAEAHVKNPLLASWSGPYGGAPPFEKVKVEQFRPALEEAMAETLANIDRIANDPAPATFENTLAALERSGRTLERVRSVYEVFSSAMSSPAFQAVEREMAPKLAAFQDRIVQNEALLARVAAVYGSRETSCKTPEQRRLAWYHFTRLVRAGARLAPPAKRRVAEINERLATLYTQFTQNLLAEEADPALFLDREAELAGLPPSVRAAMSAAAEERGRKGAWAVLDTRSSVEPFLSHSDRRELREKVWRSFTTRCDHGGARDNKAAITEILKLRAERARLLGYPTHAHWQVEDSMARTPERASQLMEAVWPAAVARVREEVADMQALADGEGAKITIEPWDYRYYAEKVRRARYDLDENEVRQYLQLETLREAMFWVAGQVYGLHFRGPLQGVPVYHPDVRVWEVVDGEGKHVGLWYLDPYARDGKQSGAWMNAYRSQERMDADVPTIVSNNANFVKGKPGEPILISWDDAQTLFHEFGHALHGLASNVTYPSLSGTNVARDYVEFPSQLLERWLETPEVLDRYALHPGTGEPLPAALREKIRRAARFNEGFATTEYLSAAIVDMRMHLAGAAPVDPSAFERATLSAIGMPRELVMRHRPPHFAHVFAGDGYSAGYYSYLWADTLSADAYEAFLEGKGPYDPEVARRLRALLSEGNTVDPADAYRAFRGRDPGVEALLRKRGFPVPDGTAPQRPDPRG
jgi:peptidyl-dipeptidase Dcp